MAGTLDNPVILDPFQVITEVGWPSRIEYIAISTQVEGFGLIPGPTETWQEFCSAGSSTVISSAEMDTIVGGPGIRSAGVRYRENFLAADRTASRYAWSRPSGGLSAFWQSIEPEVSGMPEINVINSFGPWTYASATSTGVGWRMTPASGTWNGLNFVTSLPDNPDAFNSGLSPEHAVQGRPYDGDPECYTTPALGTVRYGTTVGAPVDIASDTPDFSGVTVTYQGKTYTPVSTALITDDDDGSELYIGAFSLLWILCAPV